VRHGEPETVNSLDLLADSADFEFTNRRGNRDWIKNCSAGNFAVRYSSGSAKIVEMSQ
jgi:hypothetical protein